MIEKIGIISLLKIRPVAVCVTWGMVLIETALISLSTLMIGLTIDGLLDNDYYYLYVTIFMFLGLIILAVIRRMYDTRLYGSLRVLLGEKVADQHGKKSVSVVNARLEMSEELIEFIEQNFPEIITAFVNLIMAIIVLYNIKSELAFACLGAIIFILIIYGMFHKSFYKLNKYYNAQWEKQVHLVKKKDKLLQHLNSLKNINIKISDREAILYGLIFALLLVVLIFNIVGGVSMPGATAGNIFIIVSYTWEFIFSILVLPMTLQTYTRLMEIKSRLNSD